MSIQWNDETPAPVGEEAEVDGVSLRLSPREEGDPWTLWGYSEAESMLDDEGVKVVCRSEVRIHRDYLQRPTDAEVRVLVSAVKAARAALEAW